MKHVQFKKIIIALLILAFVSTPVFWKAYGNQEYIVQAVLVFFLIGSILALCIWLWTNEEKCRTFNDLYVGDSIYYTDNGKLIKELIVTSIKTTQDGSPITKLEIYAETAKYVKDSPNNYCFTVNPKATYKYNEKYPYFYMVSIDPKDVSNFSIKLNNTYSSVQRAGVDIKKDRVNNTIKQQYLAFKDKEVAKTKVNKEDKG